MIAIFKRDFRSAFHTVIAELFIGLNILFFGYFFSRYNLLGLNPNINGALYNTSFMGLSFMIPLLCMRSFSEEKKSRTDQLILTAPVSVGQIVLGKFMALAAIFSIPIALFLVIPPIMSRFGEIPWLWNYADILAYWLYGLMLIAICMFFSSLTENAIISVVVSIVAIFGCLLLGDSFSRIQIDWIKDILNATININERLMSVYLGCSDLTSYVFFLTVCVLFLFLTAQVILKRRYTVSRANLSFTAYSTVSIIIAVAVTVGLNILVLQIPDHIREVDLTQEKIYTITQESKDVAARITDKIDLFFLAQENDKAGSTKDDTVERILKNYQAAGSNITLSYVDPVANPRFYQRYTDTDPGYSGVIVVNETNGRSKAVPYSDMYETSIDYTTYSEQTTGYDIEGQITNALQYVSLTDDQLVQVYTLVGHGEMAFEETFTGLMEDASMHVEDLQLLTAEAMPDNIQLLIINAPTMDVTPHEAELITGYLAKGGNLLMITNPEVQKDTPNLDSILAWYDLSLYDGVVVDTQEGHNFAFLFNTPAYLLPDLSTEDTITSGLGSMTLGTVFLPGAQGIKAGEGGDDITYVPLLTSSDESYLSEEPNGAPQSYTLGIRAEKTLDSGISTAIVYTSALMFTQEADSYISGMNSRLFGKTISALGQLNEDYVYIPAKAINSYLVIPNNMRNFFTVIGFALVIAVGCIIAGVVVWAVRRRK